MTDLAELTAELLPGSAPIGDPAAAGRPIAWVRVLRPRVPAFDALDPGDVAVLPAGALEVVAPDPAALRDLVAALAAVPVSGVLLLTSDPPPPPPVVSGVAAGPSSSVAAVDAALRDAALGGRVLTGVDAGSLERSIVGFIVARGAELERQVSLLEVELRRRALEGGGLGALVATVSGFLGRALALETGRGEPIVVHAPAEAPAAAADAARYRARGGEPPAIAMRVALPAAGGREAALLVLGAEPASELARVATPRVAELLALELAAEAAIRGATDRARRAEPMPSAGPPWVVLLARQREPGGDDDVPAAREARDAVRRAVRLVAPARRLALRGDADSLELRMVAAGTTAEVDDLVDRIAATLGRTVAVSRPFATPGERPGAEGEARATLEAAATLERPPSIARADRLAQYRLLGTLHKLPDGPALALAVLEPLLGARPDVRRERIETLRAVLGHGGIGEAASALGVHRNTVAYRLRGIEAATGWRLGDPELRLALAVALDLVQEEQL